MEQTLSKTGKTRLTKPQVLIIESFWSDEQRIREGYQEALTGTEVVLVKYFELAHNYASRTHVDFTVMSVDWETSANKVRRQISAIWQVCPETKIILMARPGFDAHDARVKAVVPKQPLTALAAEIRK